MTENLRRLVSDCRPSADDWPILVKGAGILVLLAWFFYRSPIAILFLSPLFRETLANVSGASIELYDTDGAVGAARGAGLGCGLYASPKEAFASLHCLGVTKPSSPAQYHEAYEHWKDLLLKQ